MSVSVTFTGDNPFATIGIPPGLLDDFAALIPFQIGPSTCLHDDNDATFMRPSSANNPFIMLTGGLFYLTSPSSEFLAIPTTIAGIDSFTVSGRICRVFDTAGFEPKIRSFFPAIASKSTGGTWPNYNYVVVDDDRANPVKPTTQATFGGQVISVTEAFNNRNFGPDSSSFENFSVEVSTWVNNLPLAEMNSADASAVLGDMLLGGYILGSTEAVDGYYVSEMSGTLVVRLQPPSNLTPPTAYDIMMNRFSASASLTVAAGSVTPTYPLTAWLQYTRLSPASSSSPTREGNAAVGQGTIFDMDKVTISTIEAGTSSTITITGTTPANLVPNTRYFVRLATETADGQFTYGTWTSLFTLQFDNTVTF